MSQINPPLPIPAEADCCIDDFFQISNVTVPFLYQIGIEAHVDLWKFMHLENQETQYPSAFMGLYGFSENYEIRASALDI